MTRQEVSKILLMIQVTYPKQFDRLSEEMLAAMVDAWTVFLGEYDYKTVEQGLKIYVTTNNSGFAPTPGQIINAVAGAQMNELTQLTADDAWVMVKKAICNGTYGAEREFEALPPIVQKAVGSADIIRSWASLSSQENDTVTRSNFIKSFNRLTDAKRQFTKLPPSIQQKAAEVAERLAVGHREGIAGDTGTYLEQH